MIVGSLPDDDDNRIVRVVTVNGDDLGTMSMAATLKLAQELRAELVERDTLNEKDAEPSVLCLADYGKFEKVQRPPVNQVRLRLNANQADIDFKREKAIQLLRDIGSSSDSESQLVSSQRGDNSVHITVLLRGREMARSEDGRKMLDQFVQSLVPEYGSCVTKPLLLGRRWVCRIATNQDLASQDLTNR